MTQTLRRSPRQNPGVRRRGRIYGFTTLRVHESGPKVGLVLDGSTECGYVGQTIQTLTVREQQHRGGAPDGTPVPGENLEEQPWRDIAVGGIYLIEEGMWTAEEMDERERFHTERLKPRYPYMLNTDNPDRIAKPVAREHRDNRDRARGLTPRRWPPFSTQRGFRVDPTRVPTSSWQRRTARRVGRWLRTKCRLSAKWRRRRNWILAWTGTVAMLWAALVLLGAAWLRWPVPVLGWLDLSAGSVTALYVKLHVGRKKRRKLAWALTGAAMAAAAIWIAKG